MRSRRRSLASLIAVVAGAVVLAGCGSSEPVRSSGTTGSTTAPHASPEPVPPSCGSGAAPSGTTIEELPDPGGIGYGCSSTTLVPDPDTPVSTMADPGEPDPDPNDGKATEVPDQPNLASPTVQEPTEVVADPDDDRVLVVRFWGGVKQCYGAHVETDETGDQVTVTLTTGGLAEAPAIACPDIAQLQEIHHRLDAPLGDRTIAVAKPAQPRGG